LQAGRCFLAPVRQSFYNGPNAKNEGWIIRGGRTMDPEALKKLQAGDEAAFARLVEQYKNKVLNTCYRFLYNREDAGDISQEVFIEVFRSIGSFRQEADLTTWIHRIAVNKSLDFIRRRNRKKRSSEIKGNLGLDQAAARARTADDSDPSRKMEQEERLRIMQEAISRLPEKQGVAFTLSKCDGFGNQEIAAVMGLSLSAVDALVHRAKGNLQKRLTAYFEKEARKK
jgi:RNA polymerase sigma-70 factor, ECF subfamily